MDEYEKAGADRAVDLLAKLKALQAENKRLKEIIAEAKICAAALCIADLPSLRGLKEICVILNKGIDLEDIRQVLKGKPKGRMKMDEKCDSCLLNNLHCGECDGCDYSNSGYIKDPRPENDPLRNLLRSCLAVFGAEPEDATIAIPQITKEIEQVLKG